MSKFIDVLSEERARAWEQAKSLLDVAANEKRDLTAEESETFDRINADLDAKDARIKSIIDAEERTRAIEESRTRLGVQPHLSDDQSGSVDPDDQAVRALLRGEIRSHRFEKRAITKSSATMVPSSVYSRIVEHLEQANVVRQYATVLTTATGESLAIPKSTAFSTAAIVGEGAQASPADPTLGTTTLGAFKYVTLCQMSNELANDSSIDVGAFLARQAGLAIGIKTREDMTVGAGTTLPFGIVTRSSTGKTGADAVAGAFTGDDLIDLRYSVNSVYTSMSGVGWMMSSAAMAAARKLKDKDDQYLFAPGLNGSPDSLLGYQVFINDSMPTPAANAKSVIFGHFPSYFVRQVNGIEVAVSDDFAFDYSVRTFRVTLRTDGDLVDQTGAVKHFLGGDVS
jgi:HK97 family phage major capsid protein